MTPSEPGPPRDSLDLLVLHLQAADLTVAIDTVLRLRVLFGSEGLPNEPERVANMVAAVVARQPRDLQAARDATLAWLAQAPAPRPAVAVDAPPDPPVSAPAERPRGPRLAGVLITTILLIGAALLVWFALRGEPTKTILNGAKGLLEPEPPEAGVPYVPSKAPASKLAFLSTAPRLEIRAEAPTAPERPTWPLWALACFGAGIAIYGWRRTRPPGEPIPPPGPSAPPRRQRRPASGSARFVTGRDADTLAWGIDRFLTDEPTARLDLPRTVGATVAAGGAPQLHWARAKQHREIWLWVDDSAHREHPEIAQLVSEVQAALARVGLRPRIAHFWGVPDTLTEGEAPLRIDQLEDARMTARVAVLTDGRLWTRWRSEPARRREAEGALRRLGSWRQLAVIDFGGGAWPIAEHLDRHAIPQRTPAELIGWLGEFDVRVEPTTEDDRVAWAAACALCPETVTEDDALALLQALEPAGLGASPWAIRDLRERAPGPGRRLRFSAEQRAELISWLAEAEAGEGSLLARARRFWAARLVGDDPRQVAQRAWLDLFEPPAGGDGRLERAIATLLPLTHADDDGHLPVAVGDRVRQALPADLARRGAIRLPWRWADLDLYSRLRARAIGLGRAVGGLPEETVVRPGRVGLAAGLGAGVAIAAGVLAIWPQAAIEPSGPPVLVELSGGARITGPEAGEGGYWIHAEAPWGEALSTGIAAGARLRVVEGERDCMEQIDPDTLLVSCGTRPKPERVNSGPTPDTPPQRVHTTAIIEDAPAGDRWKAFAAKLLDTGSVDTVIVTTRIHDQEALSALQAKVARHVAPAAWHGLLCLAGARSKAPPLTLSPGWVEVTADDPKAPWRALAERLGDGEPMLPIDAFGKARVRGDLGVFRVRGKVGERRWSRSLPWHVQLQADRAALYAVVNDPSRSKDLVAIRGALVRVPDDLAWRGDVPLAWALVQAQDAEEFAAAIQARKDYARLALTGQPAALQAQVNRFLDGLLDAPDIADLWRSTVKVDFAPLTEAIHARLPGWQRTALRRLARGLFDANGAVNGDFPFGRSEEDASFESVKALLAVVGELRAIQQRIGENPFATDAGTFLGKDQGDWVASLDAFFTLHAQIGEWPIDVRWADGGELIIQVETAEGGWNAGRVWSPQQKARACTGKFNCRTWEGDWALLHLIDSMSRTDDALLRQQESLPTLAGYDARGEMGCVVGEKRDGRCVGWIWLGKAKVQFEPRAIDLVRLDPEAPTVKPMGGCPQTCQLHGYPDGLPEADGSCKCSD